MVVLPWGPALRMALAGAVSFVVAFGQGSDGSEVSTQLRLLEQRHQEDLDRLRREYDERVRALEGRVSSLTGRLEGFESTQTDRQLEEAIAALVLQDPDRRGIGNRVGTTVFDNIFNPAISVFADFFLVASDRDDSFEDLNQFLLRSVEIGITGRVDPLAAYYFIVHFDEEEVEVEEAYGWADRWLPDTFTLKFGRYNIDFGRFSPFHEHDLPFADKPGVLQEYLGGSLRGTGVELHHWFGLGDASLVRWSVGVVNALDGDAHPVFGPLAGGHHHEEEEEGAEPFGQRSANDMAFTARVTGVWELSSSTTLQLGLSAAYAPSERVFLEESAVDLRRLIAGTDLRLAWSDDATGERFELGVEALYSRQELFPEEGEGLLDVGSVGFYGFGEYGFNRQWSIGTSGGWYQHREDDDETSFDAGLFVTWRVNEFHRLRLEGRWFEDPDESYYGVMVQWTVMLGSHGHGVIW